MSGSENEPTVREIEDERSEILSQLEGWLEIPMLVLSLIWLTLFIVEMVYGLSGFLETVGTLIWIIFGVEFLLKFLLAPAKLDFLRSNWVTLLALALPAFRVFRAFRLLRFARGARGLRLVRLLTSLNRGMKALGVSFSRRGFGYVLILTMIVLFGGAAGMYGFEREVEGGFSSYADALWWTAMLLTSIGADYFPKSGEGRMLCLILALYGFAVFGYMTATLATFFIRQDNDPELNRSNADAEILTELKDEIADLRRLLSERLTHE